MFRVSIIEISHGVNTWEMEKDLRRVEWKNKHLK